MTDADAYPVCVHGKKVYESCEPCADGALRGEHGGFLLAPQLANLENIESLARESGDWRAAFREVKTENERLHQCHREGWLYAEEMKAEFERRGKEIEHVRAEVQRLQRALQFWLPGVPADDDEIATRAGDDAMLLVGYQGDDDACAESLGWIRLRPFGKCLVAKCDKQPMTLAFCDEHNATVGQICGTAVDLQPLDTSTPSTDSAQSVDKAAEDRHIDGHHCETCVCPEQAEFTELPESLRDPVKVMERGRELLKDWPEPAMSDADRYRWMVSHPDECASAVMDAYERWLPGDSERGDFAALLNEEIAHQVKGNQ